MKRFLALSAAGVVALVLMAPAPTFAAGSGDQSVFAVMNGNRELSPSLMRRAGDPDGHGSFSATIEGRKFCYGLTVADIGTPVAAHVHEGGPDVNGPVVITLTPPANGDPGASSGCVTISRRLAADILAHPHQYYVNVHTASFPGGAVRGQLFDA